MRVVLRLAPSVHPDLVVGSFVLAGGVGESLDTRAVLVGPCAALGPRAAILARLSVLAVFLGECGGCGGGIVAGAFLSPLVRGVTVRP